MSKLQQALQLAKKGYYVFPLKPNGKTPEILDFPNRATRDEKTINKWWVDPVLEIERSNNIGIYTGKFGDDQALVVVDVDNKNGKKGSKNLKSLKNVPKTKTQSTPTGGFHVIYRTPKAVKQGANVLGDGLDIRSRGGYIVAEGSTIDGKAYKADSSPMALCPDWILDECKDTADIQKVDVSVSEIDQGSAAKRVKKYLDSAPIAVEGAGGDDTTYKVCARVKDFGLELEAAFELLSDWNDRCQPPWDPRELQIKLERAYRYGQNSVGSSSPQAAFDIIPEDDEPDMDEKNYLEKINEQYALVYIEGNHCILHETRDVKGRPKTIFMPEASFRRKFSPYTVMMGKKIRTYAEMWLDWEKRREYDGIVFAPGRDPGKRFYNLWRGFTVEPVPYEDADKYAKEGFDAFMKHARENICQGDEELFTWLMGYLAHMVQKPSNRPLTTVVFKGKKGVGKNALIDRFGFLLGSGHYLVAHDSRYLTSNFNGHLDSCLCLVLDEAFWSGDQSANGKLKGLTTAPEILIERKGKEPYTVDNLVRLIVIGNEAWLVPASEDERRYAVFNVGEGRKQDGNFFRNMRVNMDQRGGANVLLHYLQNFDLSKVDVNKAPATQGLLDQKIESLNVFDQFWYDSLTEGAIVGIEFLNDWKTEVAKDDVYAALQNYHKSRNIRSRMPSRSQFTKQLKGVTPSLGSVRKRDGGDFVNMYQFADLKTVRAEWDKRMGQDGNWPVES
jgi:hypothetical protein